MEVALPILSLAMLVAVTLWLYKSTLKSPFRKYFWSLLLIKLAAGIALGIVFKYHYGFGDTLQYFEEASRFARLAQSDFLGYLQEWFTPGLDTFQSVFDGQPRALLMAYVTSIFALITHGNYWISSFFFSLFCFAGFWRLAYRIESIYPYNKTAILISLLIIPSVVFWSAGITKESVALGAITFLVSSFLGYITGKKGFSIPQAALDIVWVLVLWNMKYYYAGLLFLVILASVLTLASVHQWKQFLIHSAWRQLGVYLSFCVIFLVIISSLQYNLDMARMPEVIVKNHNAFLAKSTADEVIHFNNLAGNWVSILAHSPQALFSGLVRPLPGDGVGWLSLIVKAENVFILLTIITAFFGIPKRVNPVTRVLIFSVILYSMALATLLALSAPNFGTLVRYKVGFLPFLLLLVTINNPWIKRLNKWLFDN